MKKAQVVRIIMSNDDALGIQPTDQVRLFLEQLRYAGIVKICKDDELRMVIDLYAPKGVIADSWAESNANRMRSFGINAVKAPAWG